MPHQVRAETGHQGLRRVPALPAAVGECQHFVDQPRIRYGGECPVVAIQLLDTRDQWLQLRRRSEAAQILFREVDVLALGALLRGECLCEDLSQSLKNNVRQLSHGVGARVSRELQDRNLTKQGDRLLAVQGQRAAHRSAAQRKRVQFGVQCPGSHARVGIGIQRPCDRRAQCDRVLWAAPRRQPEAPAPAKGIAALSNAPSTSRITRAGSPARRHP